MLGAEDLVMQKLRGKLSYTQDDFFVNLPLLIQANIITVHHYYTGYEVHNHEEYVLLQIDNVSEDALSIQTAPQSDFYRSIGLLAYGSTPMDATTLKIKISHLYPLTIRYIKDNVKHLPSVQYI